MVWPLLVVAGAEVLVVCAAPLVLLFVLFTFPREPSFVVVLCEAPPLLRVFEPVAPRPAAPLALPVDDLAPRPVVVFWRELVVVLLAGEGVAVLP